MVNSAYASEMQSRQTLPCPSGTLVKSRDGKERLHHHQDNDAADFEPAQDQPNHRVGGSSGLTVAFGLDHADNAKDDGQERQQAAAADHEHRVERAVRVRGGEGEPGQGAKDANEPAEAAIVAGEGHAVAKGNDRFDAAAFARPIIFVFVVVFARLAAPGRSALVFVLVFQLARAAPARAVVFFFVVLLRFTRWA